MPKKEDYGETNTMVLTFHLDDEGSVLLSSQCSIGEDISDEVAFAYTRLLEGTLIKINTDAEELIHLSAMVDFGISMRDAEVTLTREEDEASKADGSENVHSLSALRRMKTLGGDN
jgi:hypothetical protein